jgi:hypothetical protein
VYAFERLAADGSVDPGRLVNLIGDGFASATFWSQTDSDRRSVRWRPASPGFYRWWRPASPGFAALAIATAALAMATAALAMATAALAIAS